MLEMVRAGWLNDGLKLLEWRWRPEQIQLTFSAMPQISPVVVAQRVKGRLDNELRRSGFPIRFSRKVSVSTVGKNRRADVERYIERRLIHHRYVQVPIGRRLQELTVVDSTVDLSQPTPGAHGRYWYNLHLVLVADGRMAVCDLNTLRDIRDRCRRIAQKHGYSLSRLSLMCDHLHTALRGSIRESPEGIALAFLNNLAHVHGRLWTPGYYAGTFGDYAMALVRKMSQAPSEWS